MQVISTDLGHAQVSRLFAVVVLYKLQPLESSSLQSLLEAARQIGQRNLELQILIWDNTPGGQVSGEVPEGVWYERATDNPGLARAYNRAAKLAHEAGYQWLLTLDQDSVLPIEFLTRLAQAMEAVQCDDTIAAIVPHVVGDNRPLSPFRFRFGTLPEVLPNRYGGTAEGAVYAVNSAATIRIEALRQIGGYDERFPLDVSDIAVFHRIFCARKKIHILGDLLVPHSFSLFEKHKRMDIARYVIQLKDECAFWDMNMGHLARVERIVRLFGRACKDLHKRESWPFSKVAIQELWRRIVQRRHARVAEWTAWVARNRTFPAAPFFPGFATRAKMAGRRVLTRDAE